MNNLKVGISAIVLICCLGVIQRCLGFADVTFLSAGIAAVAGLINANENETEKTEKVEEKDK